MVEVEENAVPGDVSSYPGNLGASRSSLRVERIECKGHHITHLRPEDF